MAKTDLSIIIVNWNTKELLRKCIGSIIRNLGIKESRNLGVEIIVVDNGSTDGSQEEVKSLKLKVKNYNAKLKVVQNRENLGFAKANNQGIKIAKGKYLLLLNSDTEVKEGALSKLMEFAKRTPDAGVIGPKLLNSDNSVQFSCFHRPSVCGAFKEFFLGKEKLFSKYVPDTNQAVIVDSVVGAAFLITPQTRKKVGLLDERYFFYFEDLDYCRRVRQSGLKVYYLPSSEIYHFHGVSASKLGDKPNKWLIKSSRIYHGLVNHYLINLVIWSGQKWQKLKRLF